MKQHIIAASVVFVLAMAGLWGYVNFVSKKDAPELATSINALDEMQKNGVPDFVFTDIEGVKHNLSDFSESVVILNFWASWCGPCIEEVPSLISLIKHFEGRVKLIAVSGDSEMNDITVFLKSFPEIKNEHIHVVFDEDKSLMKKFQVTRLPESLILDTSLKLNKKVVGSIEWFNEDSKAFIESLLIRN